MNSFDQLMKLADEASESYKNFLDKNLNVTVDEALMDYYKSQEIRRTIEDKMDKIEKREDVSYYIYDNCVYFMVRYLLRSYQYAALLVFTRKLGESFTKLIEKREDEQQKESLKHLIKEAIKEAKEQEQKPKPARPKKRSPKKD